MAYNFSAVIWDMDGTLIDTEPMHEAALIAACEKYGLKVHPHHHLVGLCINQAWEAIGGKQQSKITCEGLIDELHLEFMKKAALQEDYVRPGVRLALNTFSDAKVAQACASNSPRLTIDFNMANMQIGHHFQHTVSRDDVIEGKPHPEIYLKACEKLGLPPLKCVAVEDSPVGIHAAKAAGMTTVAFPNQTTKDLDFSQADFVIEEIASLFGLLDVKAAT